ncbi:Nucleoside-diphosphate-sugar epimerase [Dyella jiangningensis]|uniref:SDR family oxidoreductase n=1 Tax=Dyella sp. AtDHG13 TaxID=1938897 RepID=UPI000880AEBE|nr:SDR family oxidoreductase [Dyella sp. AtDHG13]PXV58988.1 nucleoside-diphosphate-sugar epimerase [Dyella sp. AtDHG13]SDL30690.1 Nucleoside-diphosphate-sugar epimerase [Dyella jiangningensis]
MRVFVTGATGFVGSAVVHELLDAGHQVLGMARSDASAEALAATGAQVHRGSLEDLDSLRRGVDEADGVIHTAFIHDFTQFEKSCEVERVALGAIGDALAGSNRPLLVTSGTGLLAPGRLATEDDANESSFPRVVSEKTTEALAARGINASVLRLPPTVHGKGDHGFVPILIKLAREKGVSAYVGNGDNRWPAVHRLDAARLYRLALEKAAGGVRYHAVAEQGVSFRAIATVIGKHLDVPVVSQSPEEAAEHFGWFAHFTQIDNHTSSAKTRAQLGWEPQQVTLLDDLEQGHYFTA